MLKPMPKRANNNMIIWIIVGVLILAGIITLIFAFKGNDDGLDQVNASYTSAAETLSAQQLTLQAVSPTITPTFFTLTPPVTVTAFSTNTLPVLITPTTALGGNTGGFSGAVGCDNSVYVADVTIQDKTPMTPGQTFTKTWKLQNTGTCPWTTSYSVTFLSGNQMNGVNTPLTITVQPGQSGDVSVNLVAPTTAGPALGYWKLANANGTQFGTSFYVEIAVGGSGTTATATATTGIIPTATVTTNVIPPTFTDTPAPSETATPTVTSTPSN